VAESARMKDDARERWALLLLLVLPTVLIWRPGFFYIGDDWLLLRNLACQPFREYVWQGDAEHFFPVFQLIYAGLVRAARESFGWLLLVNCLVSGLNACLVYRFLQRHLTSGLAFFLGLLYAISGAHTETAYTAQMLNFSLALTFYLAALLSADDYLKDRRGTSLAFMGVCAWLSVHINNFPLLPVAMLPFYGLLICPPKGRRCFRSIGVVIGLVLASFVLGYAVLKGGSNLTVHNPDALSAWPAPAYAAHLVCGGVFSPFFYVVCGHDSFPLAAIAAGVALPAVAFILIRKWGLPDEQRRARWVLLANLAPFILVSLVRYPRGLQQAFVSRYAQFTLIGAFLILGIAWQIAARHWPKQVGRRSIVAIAGAAFLIAVQLLSFHLWRPYYAGMAREATMYYRSFPFQSPAIRPDARDARQSFMPNRHPGLTQREKAEIRGLLSRGPHKAFRQDVQNDGQ